MPWMIKALCSTVKGTVLSVTEALQTRRREVEQLDGEDAVRLEADVGGGLALVRRIAVPRGKPDIVQISSAIEARSVGAGSGGFSR
jgi:hypothetical protein